MPAVSADRSKDFSRVIAASWAGGQADRQAGRQAGSVCVCVCVCVCVLQLPPPHLGQVGDLDGEDELEAGEVWQIGQRRQISVAIQVGRVHYGCMHQHGV